MKIHSIDPEGVERLKIFLNGDLLYREVRPRNNVHLFRFSRYLHEPARTSSVDVRPAHKINRQAVDEGYSSFKK